MMCSLPVRMGGRGPATLALCLSLLALLSGCTDSYPEDLRYPVRTDPLVLEVPEKTVSIPDRPGQFPIMSMSQVNDPLNPLHAIKAKADAILDPMTLSGLQRAEIARGLDELFGTPAHPKVASLGDEFLTTLQDEDLAPTNPAQFKRLKLILADIGKEDAGGLDWKTLNQANFNRILKDLKIDDEQMLARGSSLYRAQCLHCHGLPGDGRGPSSQWVNPHPRDFRQGIFKFTSTKQDRGVRKPRRDDLLRILRQGIDTTAMPAFNLLTEEQLDQLTSYVIHLSIRGQVEFELLRGMLLTKESKDISYELKKGLALITVLQWRDAQRPANLIVPKTAPPQPGTPEFVEAVRRGYRLFLTKDEKEAKSGSGNCYACHQNFGRETTYSFDSWGTLTKRANLTTGLFRGGRRPIDLYWRIYGGINGSGMIDSPSLAEGSKGDQIWDLVSFLQVLPYLNARYPGMVKEYGISLD